MKNTPTNKYFRVKCHVFYLGYLLYTAIVDKHPLFG